MNKTSCSVPNCPICVATGHPIPHDEEMTTANKIDAVCADLASFLKAKNKAYGDSALNPVRIFSQAEPVQQLLVRIDDKISRIKNMHWSTEHEGEDSVKDLAGYLILLMIMTRFWDEGGR